MDMGRGLSSESCQGIRMGANRCNGGGGEGVLKSPKLRYIIYIGLLRCCTAWGTSTGLSSSVPLRLRLVSLLYSMKVIQQENGNKELA